MNAKLKILLLAVIALLGTTSYASTGENTVDSFVQETVNKGDPNLEMYAQGAGVPECTDPLGRCYTSTVNVQLASATSASVRGSATSPKRAIKGKR